MLTLPTTLQRHRYSLGGYAVRDGITATLGAELPESVGLHETTTRFLTRGPAVLIAQNAMMTVAWSELMGACEGLRTEDIAALRLKRLVSRMNLCRAGHVICLSEAMHRITSAAYPRIDCVPVPVTVPLSILKIVGEVTQESARPPTFPEIVVPGSIISYKNLLLSLDAIEIQARVTGIHRVHLLGPRTDRNLFGRLLAAAQRNGIELRASELPTRAYLSSLREAAVVLLPSRLESLGFSLPEALLAGANVVASSIPAHEETASRLGLARWVKWFEPHDVRAMADCLVSAIEDPQKTIHRDRGLLMKCESEWSKLSSVIRRLSATSDE